LESIFFSSEPNSAHRDANLILLRATSFDNKIGNNADQADLQRKKKKNCRGIGKVVEPKHVKTKPANSKEEQNDGNRQKDP